MLPLLYKETGKKKKTKWYAQRTQMPSGLPHAFRTSHRPHHKHLKNEIITGVFP
jgi:hypothetical protein